MLITLVIIGVVAALTIPNLMQKYQEQATVKKVQKFYSNLSNAYQLAMKNSGTIDEWNLITTTKNLEKVNEILIQPYFKIAKNCGVDNKGNCINSQYRRLDDSGSLYAGTSKGYYKVALDDGTAVVWALTNTATDISIFFDTNGVKGPNQFGKDWFAFGIRRNRVFPVGVPSGQYSFPSQSFNTNCNTKSGFGYGCAAWLIYKGNMDYLHCDGLTWTSRSCKDK